MTWEPEHIVAMLAALGAGPLIHQLVTGLMRWASGAQSRERDRAQQILTDRDQAEDRAAGANQARRRAEADRDRWREYAISLRVFMLQSGCEDVPDLPPDL